jgi:hypothetical protein
MKTNQIVQVVRCIKPRNSHCSRTECPHHEPHAETPNCQAESYCSWAKEYVSCINEKLVNKPLDLEPEPENESGENFLEGLFEIQEF